MNVLIIEDELPAQEKLSRLLLKYDNSINIIARLTSVSSAISWLKANEQSIRVIFMDIQLSDGLSFDIFENVTCRAPIIFTTAYEEYAIDAFRVNSVDYLLKPVTYTNLARAMRKLDSLSDRLPLANQIARSHTANYNVATPAKTYKDRFLVKVGSKIQMVSTDKIEYIEADGRTVYINTSHGKRYIIDYTLAQLADLLSPDQFYRVNRSIYLQLDAISSVLMYSNSRLKVLLTRHSSTDIVVSREKVKDFKHWMSGKQPTKD